MLNKMLRTVIALTVITLTVISTGASAQECQGGLVRCPAGSSGSGGCYSPGSTTCEDGIICPAPLKVCRKGNKARGGCYNIGQFICDAGKICQISNPNVCLN
jgi:hypothetical protein